MSDDVIHRLSTEGVDPLSLAGVNDGNLVELAKRLGVRVSLRGDTLTLQGSAGAVERAAQVAQALVDLARVSPTYMRAPLTLGLAVIIEEASGGLSYWALAHPSDRPDFHHAGAFALELDEVRD